MWSVCSILLYKILSGMLFLLCTVGTWFCVTRYVGNMLSYPILCHILCLQRVVWPDFALCAMHCCACLICNTLCYAQLPLMLCLLYIIAHAFVLHDFYVIHCCTCFLSHVPCFLSHVPCFLYLIVQAVVWLALCAIHVVPSKTEGLDT